MNIVQAYPPNYEDICNVLDIKDRPSIIFTYGDTVYNPDGGELPHHLCVHEQTHINQQRQLGPDEWWFEYLIDKQFRLEQELEAYRAQWKAAQKLRNWKEIQFVLSSITKDLASEMYGNVITRAEAQKLITAK